MSQNVISNILAEEEKAAALMLDAQNSANEIVKNAESLAAEAERKAAVENRARFQQVLDERRRQVELALQRQNGDASRPAQSIDEDLINEAIKYVVQEVKRGNR